MKPFYLLFTIVAFIALSTPTVAQQKASFLSVLPEMPLMPGLVEVPDTKVIFDGPSGRIVEIIVIGNVELDKINTFYATALPQLGWVLLSNGDYNRGSEILRIDKIPNFTGSTKNGVHFVVHPARSD